jgi:transcriptional regulator with XRE-family HTH domain
MDIGHRIRSIRIQQGRTLADLASACGCSKSLLSKIENNRVVPAIATLSEIAKALGVRMSTLMEDGEDISPAFSPNMIERPDAFIKTSKGYSICALAPHFVNKKMQPVLIASNVGAVRPHAVTHEGEEFILILEGAARVSIGREQYDLKKGESIYFRTIDPHSVLPTSEQTVYLDVFIA